VSRRAAERRGHRAEALASLWLRLKFYRILGRRLRTPAGEIDIVAARGRTLTFVEVKARDHLLDADAALAPARLRRVARAANHLLGRFGRDWQAIRIDAIVIARGRLPRHIAGVIDGEWT
jgi:putative endonuclease